MITKYNAEYTEKEKEVLKNWDDCAAEQIKDKIFYAEAAATLIWAIERTYSREQIKYWGITKIIPSEGRFILEWQRRFMPLDEEGLKKIFG